MRTAIVADDEPITRLDISQMLEELGFQVLGQASDGFDAVELCRAHHPDVALLDVRMPIFDGLGAAETIVNEELSGCVIDVYKRQIVKSRTERISVHVPSLEAVFGGRPPCNVC